MIVQKKMFFWLVIVWSFGDMVSVEAINILGIVTSTSKSHNHHATAIYNELANSGHSVTVLSPYQQSQKINHFPLENVFPRDKDRLKKHWSAQEHDYFSETFNLDYEGLLRTKLVAKDPSFQKLLSADLNIDVIIFDYDYNEALLGLADIFNCPVILLTIGRLKGLATRSLGLPYPLHNSMNFLHYTERSLFENVQHLFLVIVQEIFIDFYYHGQQENLYNEIFSEYKVVVPFHDTYRKSIAKILISTLSDQPFLTPSDMVDVTGIHIPSNNLLEFSFQSERLDDFIHSAESGCIYVSLGADVNPLTLPTDKLNTIFRVLYTRPEKVIWAWNGNTSVFGSSSDFYMDRWLPQNDILRHDNIKLFVTSGGQLSLIEAIHHEVPIIGIPITAEQSETLDDIQSQGLGIKLDLFNVSTSSLTWALSEILDNTRFHENLVGRSESMQDQPMTPVKTMKFWLNYVYRHRHTAKRNRHRRMLAVNYYFLDAYLFSSAILIAVMLGVIFVLRYLRKRLTRILAKRKLKLY